MSSQTTVQVEMPEMGESVTEGTILEWVVSEGDEVEQGDTLCEVSTDKVDQEIPAPESGTVAAIKASEDDTVEVGQVIAEIDTSGGGGGSSDDGDEGDDDQPDESDDDDAEADADADAESEDDESSSDDEDADVDESGEESSSDDGGEAVEGETIDVEMPQMGESVTEGTVLEWIVSEGDEVEEGDTLVEVSTDKVDAEVPAPTGGVISELVAEVDQTVEVGSVLARMVEGASGGGSSSDGDSGGSSKSKSKESDDSSGGDASSNGKSPESGGDATPVAKRVAEENDIDLSSIDGTGRGGKITKADVLAAADGDGGGSSKSSSNGDGDAQRLKGPAARITSAMEESLEVPTATSMRELAVDTLDAKRSALNPALKKMGMKVSFTHLVAWAIVRAVAEKHPDMAHTYEVRDDKPHRVDHGQVNLGIAVDMKRKGERFLMVPCIRGADQGTFADFHTGFEELISKTRENNLTADDFAGTNVSLTNPGGIGTIASVPRLMADQGTIVATGRIGYPAQFAHASPDRIRQLGIAKTMFMTSTYDHRIIQGAESGAFLKTIEDFLAGDEFYEQIAEDLDVPLNVVKGAHAAARSAPPLGGGAAQASPLDASPDIEVLQGVQAATSLLKAYRTHGHLAARLDPLGSEPKGDPALEPENLELTPELMRKIPASILRLGVSGETLLDVLPRMRDAYCDTIGYQIEHLSSHQQRMWLRHMIETGSHRQPLSEEESTSLLERLISVFQFERFLQRTYLGSKTFSIEGLDVTVPMLDELITLASRNGAEEVVFGMAHRGRLSVLTHNIGRSLKSLLAEFEGAKQFEAVEGAVNMPSGGTGDVKYHHGATGLFETRDGDTIQVRLHANPSHLEFVDPVVEGSTRATQSENAGPKLHHNPKTAVPVLLHGDAAFPGQGVVAETLNLQSLPAYSTGGTIHIIQDNQLGFTTEPTQGRSTPYAADLAKGFNVPIIHVNADDPEACLAAVRLAMAYREKWSRDIVIDLIGYRRYGHNETDEPAYTQPAMYAKIDDHSPVSELYASKLVGDGVVDDETVEQAGKDEKTRLQGLHKELKKEIEGGAYEEGGATQTGTYELDQTHSPEVQTAVDEEPLRILNEELVTVPDSFTMHRKLRKPLTGRIESVDEEHGIDYGHAESLAFASLLTEGTHVRLTGQDSQRGTFSHRHLVLFDEKTGLAYVPMQNLPDARAPFEVHNSPLSEIACLGFEYGYSTSSSESLIVWEGQFGDFVNAGQVILDQFIVSGEAKWGTMSRLTLLLPHGYEGQGPEHSSARLERWLTLAAEGNIRIANPTTSAQYFHLLRRQARLAKPRPLIMMTPKSLLREKRAATTLSDLTTGHFRFVLDDPEAQDRRDSVTRLILCSGKVYYDVDKHEKRAEADHVAIARVELLYPFARTEIRELVASYPNLKEVMWMQEEPQNMGAWPYMQNRIRDIIPEELEFRYVGRPRRASPSEGYPDAHRMEQERIVLTGLSKRQ
ncbi:MAG: multifunctional oxoglutarate decarboxylase/oxoglutarate dehydrogenase thiamine pyrophosphate-binding subunit/dihydrolipoyllysine-residue succinyltransferase subunit [Solirubrobacterales bacterium]